MIYLFAGDDVANKRRAYEIFIKSISKDTLFYISRNNFDQMQIESFYSGASLFNQKSVVVFEKILEYEENRDFILEKLPLMEEAINDFVFLESKLTKIILDDFKKVRAELNVFELSKEKKEKYDNFLLAYDLETRNRFNLWFHFRQAMDVGVGMEELVGVLFWKAKEMLQKKNYGKFTEEELINFASKISYILPEARKKGLDDEAVFEQFILEAL